MNSLVKHNDKYERLINDGKKIIENSDFLKDLSNLMECDEFQVFYSKHMTNWIDIKCSAIYMRLYSEFKSKYKKISNVELDKHVVVFLLRKIMTDKELRPISITMIDKMQDKKWDTEAFWSEFEDYMLVNQRNLVITDGE